MYGLRKMLEQKKQEMQEKHQLSCKAFCQSIPEFIEEKMDVVQAEYFLNHYRKCSNCREEMELVYLIQVGLGDEQDYTLNLQEEMENLMSDYQEEITYYHKVSLSRHIIIGFGELVTAVCVLVWCFFL